MSIIPCNYCCQYDDEGSNDGGSSPKSIYGSDDSDEVELPRAPRPDWAPRLGMPWACSSSLAHFPLLITPPTSPLTTLPAAPLLHPAVPLTLPPSPLPLLVVLQPLPTLPLTSLQLELLLLPLVLADLLCTKIHLTVTSMLPAAFTSMVQAVTWDVAAMPVGGDVMGSFHDGMEGSMLRE